MVRRNGGREGGIRRGRSLSPHAFSHASHTGVERALFIKDIKSKQTEIFKSHQLETTDQHFDKFLCHFFVQRFRMVSVYLFKYVHCLQHIQLFILLFLSMRDFSTLLSCWLPPCFQQAIVSQKLTQFLEKFMADTLLGTVKRQNYINLV